MAKVKYGDLSKVESRPPQPQPGLYRFRVKEANYRNKDGKNDIELISNVVGGKYNGAQVWNYIGLGEAAAWKLKELITAVGLKLKGGVIDTAKLKNKEFAAKIVSDTNLEGEYRARMGRMMALDDEEFAYADDEDEDEDDEDDEEEEDEDEDEDEDEEDEEDEIDLDELSLKELRALAKERDVYKKGMSEDELKEALSEGDDEAPDYNEWSVEDLRAECERRSLKRTGKKELLIERLEEDDEDDDDAF